MSPLYDALLPVVLLIAAGYFAGARRWVDAPGARQLAALSFSLLCPALLFRTMSTMRIDWGGLTAVLGYLAAELLIFTAVALRLGAHRQAIILAMTSTFGNTVMIGIPLIGLAFGAEGLVFLLAVVSAHSVLMLTVVTVSLEWLGRHDRAGRPNRSNAALSAIGQAIVHPITLPILLGLAWGQTGWSIPLLIDRPLQWLGQAFSPIALLMVGITLAHIVAGYRPSEPTEPSDAPTIDRATAPPQPRHLVWGSMGFTLLKNVLHPLLAGSFCLALGLRGLPVAVIIVAASLPIGATVLLFAQRYDLARDRVTTAIATSTFTALVTLPIALTVSARLL